METSNTSVSFTRTDYGSTTPADEDIDEVSFAFAASRFSAHSGGYQSLPQTSSSNLYFSGTHSHRSSHYHTMGADSISNVSLGHQMWQRIEFFISVINQMCIGFVTIYMSWLCLRTGLAGTALHAWLVTIGYSFLMAEGIMCHYSGNMLTFSYKRNTKTTIHWILQAVGGGCGVAGSLIKLIPAHFQFWGTHGRLGFATFILCLVSMLSGIFSLFSMRIKKILSPLLNKTFHNFIGIATFVVALVTQYYGYQTGFFSRKVSMDFQIMMKVLTLVSLVLTCIGPFKALYQKIRNIIRN